MRIALDDDSASRQLLAALRKGGHDVSIPSDLVQASGGTHPGIMLVHLDNDPTRDLTPKGIATAVAKLESSGVPLSSELHVLNHWR
jgi:hypothetical protein